MLRKLASGTGRMQLKKAEPHMMQDRRRKLCSALVMMTMTPDCTPYVHLRPASEFMLKVTARDHATKLASTPGSSHLAHL